MTAVPSFRVLFLISLALAALLAPALWNGYPVVFFDTGGYILRAVEIELEPGRSLFYGLFLRAASLNWFSLWGPVLLQAGWTLWLIHLTMRVLNLPGGAGRLALIAGGLALTTGLPWYSAQLMPDILLPLLVLGFWLLGFQRQRLQRWERWGVAGISLLALLSHMAGIALGAGLVLVVLALAGWCRWQQRSPNHRLLNLTPMGPLLILLTALAGMPLLHGLLVGQAVYTPGGPVFIFGRLVQDGLAGRWLQDHCPQQPDASTLCPWRESMPATADDFVWHAESPFRKIGWWQGGTAELSRLNGLIIRAYPLEFVRTAVQSSAQQFILVGTGDGLDEWQEVTRHVFRSVLTNSDPAFSAARQQQQLFTRSLFDNLNRVHRPVAWISLLAFPVLLVWAWRRRQPDIGLLAGFILLALAGNAVINGALSNPHDRYQSRMVWLAPLILALAVAGRSRPSPPVESGKPDSRQNLYPVEGD